MANFLAHIHGFGPKHRAGAETYITALLEFLVEAGHTCKVLTSPAMGENGLTINGVTMLTGCNDEEVITQLYTEADYVLTHLDLSVQVIAKCHRFGKKLIYLVHNYHSIPYWRVQQSDCYMVVYNAEWMRDYHNTEIKFNHPNEFVLIPPTNFKRFNFTPSPDRECISLINMNENKGALQFIMQAKLLPQYKFLGVKGAYGDQFTRATNNLEIINHTNNIVDDVFKKTKILLMPSQKETWGMAAIEAMCSGIPVIANPTDGLLEACGSAGLFALRDKAYVWRDLILKLMNDKEFYDLCSNNSISRAKFLYEKAYAQLSDMEKRLSSALQH